MRVMLRGWRLGVVVGTVVLTVVGVYLASSTHRRGLEESFRSQGITFVVAFTDAAEAWLADGDTEAIERAARLMFLGSVLYVQVSSHGDVQVDARRETLASTELPALDRFPRVPQAEYRRIAGGKRVLDVTVPLLTGGPGHVRVGLDPGEIVVRSRSVVLAAVGIGVGLDLALCGGLFWIERRRPTHRAPEGKPGLRGVQIGDLMIEEEGKQVLLAGKPVALPPKPYALLALLASQPGRVFSDREILTAVWPDSRYANAKDVKQHIYLLRKKLRAAKPGAEKMIVNVPGFGYRLELRRDWD